jgi:hypothetical protein
MATLSQVTAAAEQVNNIYNQYIPKLESIISQMKAINPNETGASAKLEQLEQQYQSTKNEANAARSTANSNFSSLYQTLNQSDKTAFENSSIKKTIDQNSTKVNSLGSEHTSVYNSQKDAIAKNNATTANASSGTNTTGTDQAKTDANNITGAADGDNAGDKTDQKKNTTSSDSGGSNTTAKKEGGSGITPYPNEFFNPSLNASLRPGRRPNNPLSNLASYNYQISLYMITKDAYTAFVEGGMRDINAFVNAGAPLSQNPASSSIKGGAYLIAQSGGMKPNERVPGLEYDFYIDDLKFDHQTLPETASSVCNLNIDLKIIEPYGFSFLSKLKKAKDELRKYDPNMPDKIEATFYVLGIRFYGWDQGGRQVKGSDIYDGVPIDPNSTSTSLFESFYAVSMTELKFKLDGRPTTYEIKMQEQAITAFTVRKGIVPQNMSGSGVTVRDVLLGDDGILTKLNKDLVNFVKDTNPKVNPMKYQIEWLGDADLIANATFRGDADTQKNSTPGSTATKTSESNDATAIKSQPQVKSKTHTAAANDPIVKVIEDVVLRSSYVEDALNVNYTDAAENDPKSKSAPNVTPSYNKAIMWFSISPKLSNIEWVEKIHDWTYTITYVIQTYLIPVIDNPYVNKTTKYYGPHKRYEYWYTGNNKEVLSYETRLDNLWYTLGLGVVPGKTDQAQGNQTNNSEGAGHVAPGTQSPAVTAGDGHRSAAASSFKTSLFDQTAWAKADINIVGDPDFLMQPTITGVNQVYSKHYGADGYTVNPTGGQVFIEIDFKEAIDYSSSSVTGLGEGYGVGGTLSLNESIAFTKTPNDLQTPDPVTGKPLVQGVSYQLINLSSSFSGGTFKQTLHCNINSFGKTPTEATKNNVDGSVATDPSTAPAANNTNTTVSASPPPDKSVETKQTWYGTVPVKAQSNVTTTQITSATGNAANPETADDDATSN